MVIISQVLCGYEVQINVVVFIKSESPPLTEENSTDEKRILM